MTAEAPEPAAPPQEERGLPDTLALTPSNGPDWIRGWTTPEVIEALDRGPLDPAALEAAVAALAARHRAKAERRSRAEPPGP